MTLFSVEGLRVGTASGITLVHDLSVDVQPGEIVGLVGQSGSGKTVTSLALMGLLGDDVKVLAGEASLGGVTYLSQGRIRSRPNATMIFQDPTAALNPTMRIGNQLSRLLISMKAGKSPSRKARHAQAVELLESVGIDHPSAVARRYPHQLSGGMNQRVMIAMALAADPDLLIADEPTTGLDVTVQAQILRLIRESVRTRSLGVIFVSHDMGVVAQMCQRVAVMYQGRVREFAAVDDIFHAPKDDYTRELLAAAGPVQGGSDAAIA